MFYTTDRFWTRVNIAFVMLIVLAIGIMGWHHTRPFMDEWTMMAGQWWRSMKAECVVLQHRYEHAREAEKRSKREGNNLNDRMGLLIAAIEAQNKWSRCVRGEPIRPAWQIHVIPPKPQS